MKKIKFVLAFSFLALLLLVPKTSKAADMGIQISPLTYNFDIQPGNSQEAKIIVTNTNTSPLSYIVETENFSSVDNEGAPSFSGSAPSDASVTTLKDWISLKNKADLEGVIQPKETKEIYFGITVPDGAEPGGHYAAIFAKEVKKTAEGKTQLGVSSRVGALILVSVPGNVTKSAEMSALAYPPFLWRGPANFSLAVKNTGTTHYDSKATVEIKSLLGNVQKVDMGTHTLIPNSARDYTGTWQKKYPFGRYAVTFMATDGNGQVITENAVIWAIPLIIVVPILVGLALLIYVITYLGRHVKFVPSDDEAKTE